MTKFWLICLIIILGFALRFYHLDRVPVSPDWDEAAIGYNSYSILLTGKDEFSVKMPLLFKSFGDYKLPGYFYLTTIPVKIFGLSVWSTRLTSAVLGTLAVLITYLLVNELIPRRHAALISALLLAISPWQLQFSRAAFEANGGLFVLLLAIWLFLKGIKNSKYFFISMLIFGLCFYFYWSLYLIAPIILLILGLTFRNKLLRRSNIKKVTLGIIILGIVSLPILSQIFFGPGKSRAGQVSVFENSFNAVVVNSNRLASSEDNLVNKIIYNRRVVWISEIISGYTSHFSPGFLFQNGDANSRHGPRQMGVLYLWEAPFLILGIISLIISGTGPMLMVLLWFLSGPIPAALAVPTPHALRALDILPSPQIIISVGLISLFVWFKKLHLPKIIFASLISLVIFISTNAYLQNYYFFSAAISARDWGDGYPQMMAYLSTRENDYDQIIISGHYWKPYIYILFYQKYDPAAYQKNGTVDHFGKYLFGPTTWDKDKNPAGIELGDINLKNEIQGQRILVILSPSEFAKQSKNLRKLTEITDSNKKVTFIAGELL